MVFVSRVRTEIDFDIWRQLYDEYQRCERSCADQLSASLRACREAHPVPPNGNITPALVCMAAASQQSRDCLRQCSVDYLTDVVRLGEPQGPIPEMPEPFSGEKAPEVVDFARRAGDAIASFFVTTGLVVSMGVHIRVEAAKAQYAGTALKRFWGTMGKGTVAIAGAFGISAAVVRQIADDPPRDDFADIVRPRPVSLAGWVPELFNDGEPTTPLPLSLLTASFRLATHLEAVAVSLERSSGAQHADDEAAYRMQLNALRLFALLCLEDLDDLAQSRTELAARIAGMPGAPLTDTDDGYLGRIMPNPENFSFEDVGAELPDLVVTHDDATALASQWAADGVDLLYADVGSRFLTDADLLDAMTTGLLNVVPDSAHFGRTPAEILELPVFDEASRQLAAALEMWR